MNGGGGNDTIVTDGPGNYEDVIVFRAEVNGDDIITDFSTSDDTLQFDDLFDPANSGNITIEVSETNLGGKGKADTVVTYSADDGDGGAVGGMITLYDVTNLTMDDLTFTDLGGIV
jgi:hypothetical protein